MPMSPEVRGLGPRWKPILARVPAYMAGVSMDGVPLSAFEDACLSPVAPSDRPAIIQALKAKRLIFPVRNGAAWRVYPAKPESRRFSKPTDTALDQFLRAASPHMNRIAEIIAAGQGSADRENRLQEAEACRLLAGLMQRHFDKGLALGDARDALWRTFNADVMAVVSRRDPILGKESRASAVAPRKAKPKKARANAEIEERIVGLVEKAGSEGITKTDLGRSLGKARPRVAELDAMIVSLEGTGMLQTGTMKLTRRGRPGFRLFSGQIEMPRVMNDGLAVFA